MMVSSGGGSKLKAALRPRLWGHQSPAGMKGIKSAKRGLSSYSCGGVCRGGTVPLPLDRLLPVLTTLALKQ